MITKEKNKISKVYLKHKIDECPDLSWLGEFGKEPKEYPIEHEPNNSRTYNYFNAENVENMEQAQQNYNRIMQFENGNVCMLGIIAYAEIVINNICQTVQSCGLWGIESDSDKSYLGEIEKQELDSLCDVLHSLGFTKEEIASAIDGEVQIIEV